MPTFKGIKVDEYFWFLISNKNFGLYNVQCNFDVDETNISEAIVLKKCVTFSDDNFYILYIIATKIKSKDEKKPFFSPLLIYSVKDLTVFLTTDKYVNVFFSRLLADIYMC